MDAASLDAMQRVTDALDGFGITVAMQISEDSTHTAAQAAGAAGCELGQIVKTLAVIVAGQPLLALVPGDRRLDDRLLAARFAVGRKQVKLATPDEVLALTGYEVGGVSPFGLPAPLPVLVDESFRRFQTIWLAGGTPNAIFPMALDDVANLLHAEFAAIST